MPSTRMITSSSDAVRCSWFLWQILESAIGRCTVLRIYRCPPMAVEVKGEAFAKPLLDAGARWAGSCKAVAESWRQLHSGKLPWNLNRDAL